MSLFPRRVPPVAADVGDGFVATEAPAMQLAIRSALNVGEGRRDPVPAELSFEPGAAERVVVRWRNRFVGFVPTSHRAQLRGQLAAAGKAPLVTTGTVYWDGAWWRVWVGPVRPDGPPPVEEGYDELKPPPPSIFGIPLSRPDRQNP